MGFGFMKHRLTITADGQDKFQCLARMLNAAQELYGGDEGPKLKVQFKWETVDEEKPEHVDEPRCDCSDCREEYRAWKRGE